MTRGLNQRQAKAFGLAGSDQAEARGIQPLQLRVDARTPVRLVVQPLRSGPYYRVDAALPAGQAGLFGMDDVLFKARG